MTSHLIIGMIFAAALAYANGSNDVSKGIATLVGSGMTDYRKAVLWGAIWTISGSLLASVFAFSMVSTFTNGWLSSTVSLTAAFPVAVIIGATVWVLFASKAGLPVSTTHAITGAVVGTGIYAFGVKQIFWNSLIGKIFIPLLFSPLIAIVLVFLILPIAKKALTKWTGHCLCLSTRKLALLGIGRSRVQSVQFIDTVDGVVATQQVCRGKFAYSLNFGIDSLHWLSSGATSFARGLNDAPKIAAFAIALSVANGNVLQNFNNVSAFVIVAISMGLGSYLGGYRVTEVLAEKVTKMDHLEGLSANFVTATLVAVAAHLGMPVSTTHVSSSAIIGIGLRQGAGEVQWKTVRDMLISWVITLPVTGIFAALAFSLISLIS